MASDRGWAGTADSLSGCRRVVQRYRRPSPSPLVLSPPGSTPPRPRRARLLTSTSSRPSIRPAGRTPVGTTARRNPRRAASASRRSSCGTLRTSPPSPSSPIATVSRVVTRDELRAGDREREREVEPALGDAQTTRHAGVDVGAGGGRPRRDARAPRAASPGAPTPCPRPTRRGIGAAVRIDQRLHLDQDRPRALEHRGDRRTRHARAAVGEEPGRRVGHVGQTVLGHLEQPDLVGAAEAVLQRVQGAQRVATVAVEREHGVDDVLEHARARERALLGDVPDEHRGATVLLGVLHEPVRAVAHLGDRPGRAGEIGIDDGLDGVDARAPAGRSGVGVGEDVRQARSRPRRAARAGARRPARRAASPARTTPRR